MDMRWLTAGYGALIWNDGERVKRETEMKQAGRVKGLMKRIIKDKACSLYGP